MNDIDKLQKLIKDTKQARQYMLITPDGNLYKGTPVELMRLLTQYHPYLFTETIPDTLEDGVPCNHSGCLHHATHPCERCGRIAGRNSDNLP